MTIAAPNLYGYPSLYRALQPTSDAPSDAVRWGSDGLLNPSGVTGLQLWLDADDASTFTYSSANVVSQWNDKSGNGRHASQGTVASQPLRVGYAQNGRAVVRFDGSNDYLTSASTISGTAFTYIAAFMRNTTKLDQILFTQGGTSGFYSFKTASAANNVMYGFATPAGLQSLTATQLNWYYVGSMVFNGASSFIRVGTETGVTGTTGSATQSGFGVGGSSSGVESWWGVICELAVYNRVLTSDERRGVEMYMAAKWGTV